MTSAEKLITDHIDVWSSAIKQKSASGRGSSSKQELYGIKKLRELILELAVRGLLVPQDSNETSVSSLFNKIAEEKQELIDKNIIKKQKINPSISDEEIPYELPESWVWMRLPDVAFFQEGPGILAKDFREKGTPLIRISGMHGNYVSLEGCNFLEPDMVKTKWEHFRLDLDDIVISSSASLGKVARVNKDTVGCIVYTGLIRFKPYSILSEEYMSKFFSSTEFLRQINSKKTGAAIKHFGPTHLKGMIIPIPNVSEQKRIVAKVDELMALCDQLESEQENSLSAHQTLVETLLATLVEGVSNAADNNSFEAAWARIAEHFDTLFTTEQSIEQLKQTILQLAVMGKLVPQDPKDEPASVLLEKIAAEKAQLIKDKKIKKEKALDVILPEDEHFDLPLGWAYERLGNICSRMGSGSTPRGGKSAYVESGIPFLRSQNVWNGGLHLDDIAYITDETHEKMKNTHVFPNDVLLNITGASLGRSVIFPRTIPTANVSQHVTIIRLIEKTMNKFIHLCIQSPLVQQLVWGRQVGMAIEGLSKKVLERFEFPVPPLEEQKRIVAKVDEIMAICDQLKTHINTAQTTQLQIADAMSSQAMKQS